LESASCSYVANNSYTLTLPDSGNVTVCVQVINEHGCVDSACITIAVTPLPPAPVLSGGGTLCASNAALNCFGETGYSYQLQDGMTQAVGVPLSGANAQLNFPITASGTYTVVATDAVTSCVAVSDPQTATLVLPGITLSMAGSSSYVTLGNAVDTILYETTYATGATLTAGNFPPGVAGTWENNSYTISGTPTATGTYTYTVSTTNALNCANASMSGSIITKGCNPSSLTLGAVGFTSSATYNINGIIVSSPVTVTYCNSRPPAGFTPGSDGNFYADCANNTCNASAGNWFSPCFVLQYKEQLCKSPWRVPTRADLSIIKLNHPNGDVHNNGALDNPVLNALPTGVMRAGQQCPNYYIWMGGELYPHAEWHIRVMEGSSTLCCEAFWLMPFSEGAGVRCVRDP
jgi:hypothetical protein